MIDSETFSPIMTQAAWVWLLTVMGMIDPSATRRPSTPWTRSLDVRLVEGVPYLVARLAGFVRHRVVSQKRRYGWGVTFLAHRPQHVAPARGGGAGGHPSSAAEDRC